LVPTRTGELAVALEVGVAFEVAVAADVAPVVGCGSAAMSVEERAP
jgi:hypothetical protein